MPGRPRAQARKAAIIEAAALAVFRLTAKHTPEMHKETERRHGASAPSSPWVHVYRLAVEFLLAVDELGQHSRRAAGIVEPGPIWQAMAGPALGDLRRKYQRGAGGRTLEEMGRFRAAAELASPNLPVSVSFDDEVAWVSGHVAHPEPDFTQAPSQIAVSFWLSLQESTTLRRDFWIIQMQKRMSCGDRYRPAARPCSEPETEMSEAEHEELMDRLFGPNAEWRKVCEKQEADG